MGDYTKLIVSCQVKVDLDELNAKLEALSLHSSAYHSQEIVEHIVKSDWHHRESCFDIVLVGQTKYGKGQEEFLKWLEPLVVDASGTQETWAFQIWECGIPKMWHLKPQTEEQLKDF